MRTEDLLEIYKDYEQIEIAPCGDKHCGANCGQCEMAIELKGGVNNG